VRILQRIDVLRMIQWAILFRRTPRDMGPSKNDAHSCGFLVP
jgi:hypothetical protein